MGKTLKLVRAYCYLCLVISLTLDRANIWFLGHCAENVLKSINMINVRAKHILPRTFVLRDRICIILTSSHATELIFSLFRKKKDD